MKISFKYAILAPIFGVVVVVMMMVSAPIVLGVIHFLTAKAPPTEIEVCAHFDSVGIKLKDCPAWVAASKAELGDLYPNQLRCYYAAADVDAAQTCTDIVVLSTDRWAE